MAKNKISDICPHCGKGKLQLVAGNSPYNVDYLSCSKCDSTYVLAEQSDKKNDKLKD